MSVFFEHQAKTIWNPSSNTAAVFVDQITALQKLVGKPCGVTPSMGDEYELSPAELTDFLAAAIHYWQHSQREEMRLLLAGVLTVLLAMHYALVGHWHPQAPAELLAKAQTLRDFTFAASTHIPV